MKLVISDASHAKRKQVSTEEMHGVNTLKGSYTPKLKNNFPSSYGNTTKMIKLICNSPQTSQTATCCHPVNRYEMLDKFQNMKLLTCYYVYWKQQQKYLKSCPSILKVKTIRLILTRRTLAAYPHRLCGSLSVTLF